MTYLRLHGIARAKENHAGSVMEELGRHIYEASKLSVLDAAYYLARCSKSYYYAASNPELFHWLKRAHPSIETDALHKSILYVDNFDRDCDKCFQYTESSLVDDVHVAVEKAAQLNPGFSKETLDRAILRMCRALR
jgi:hypothetical protein